MEFIGGYKQGREWVRLEDKKDKKDNKEYIEFIENTDDTVKQEGFIVVGNGFTSESVYYHGQSEIEAYRHYKRACEKGKAHLYWATIYTCLLCDVTFIERYEILEVIK